MKNRLEFLVKLAGFSFLSLGIGALYVVYLLRSSAR